MTYPVRYRTPTEKMSGNVLTGVAGLMALDTVINLFQGDFIVTVVHGFVAGLTYQGANLLKGK